MKIEFNEWSRLGADLWRARSLRAVWDALFMPPGSRAEGHGRAGRAELSSAHDACGATMSLRVTARGRPRPGRWRVLQWLWHELRVGLPISLVAAVFISTMFRDPFVHTLIYLVVHRPEHPIPDPGRPLRRHGLAASA